MILFGIGFLVVVSLFATLFRRPYAVRVSAVFPVRDCYIVTCQVMFGTLAFPSLFGMQEREMKFRTRDGVVWYFGPGQAFSGRAFTLEEALRRALEQFEGLS